MEVAANLNPTLLHSQQNKKMNIKTRNITGRNVTAAGTKLNVGLDTVSTFELVTSALMEWSENVRIRFTTSQGSSNNYLSADNHISQFSVSSGSVFVDGNSYNNSYIAKHSQFISPQEGYVKSIQGYIVATGSSSCEEETITISAWRKTADVDGISTTPMNLIYSQDIVFNSPQNQLVKAINSKLFGTYNKLIMNEGEGVIFSIKRSGEGSACVSCVSSLTMVFESTENQANTEEFMFPSLSASNNRLDETISSPDPSYRFIGSTATKISE